MALSMKALFFTFPAATTATNTFDCTGFGFQPKAYILFWNGRSEATDAVGLLDSQVGVGFGVDATHRAFTNAFYDQGTTAAIGGSTQGLDAVMKTCAATGTANGAVDHSAYLSDGIRFIVDDQLTADIRVMIVAFGGDDITNATVMSTPIPLATGDEDYTGAGFDPGTDSCCFFIGLGAMEDGDTVNEDTLSIMFGASRTADATQQYVTLINSDDDSATMDTDSHSRSGQVQGHMTPAGAASLETEGSFVQSITDGIRLNFADVTAEVRTLYTLIIKGGQWHLGDLLTQTDTTTDITESGMAFQPRGAIFVSHCLAESSSTDAAQAGAQFSVGACTSTSDEVGLGFQDEDATANMETSAAIEHDAVYARIASDSTIAGLMRAETFPTSDGFVMRMSDADPAQAFVWYVAAGDNAGGGGGGNRRRRVIMGAR